MTAKANLNVIKRPTFLVIKSAGVLRVDGTDHVLRPALENGGKIELETKVVKVLSVGSQGPQGIQGPVGPQGPPGPGGLTKVQDDPDPHLGGHLILGAYNIVGQLENTDLILDGGLL